MEGPRTFFELTADLYTVGVETFVGNVLTLARAQNVATGASSPFPQLSAEAIIAADPEVVLLADGAWGESLETVCARPGWDATSACINERVHPVDGDLTSRPRPARGRGPRGDRATALPRPVPLSPRHGSRCNTRRDMEIVYSNHALERMEEREIAGRMVESLLLRPERVVEGETADEYSGTLEDGRRAIIVLSRGREPRTVITVMLARGE